MFKVKKTSRFLSFFLALLLLFTSAVPVNTVFAESAEPDVKVEDSTKIENPKENEPEEEKAVVDPGAEPVTLTKDAELVPAKELPEKELSSLQNVIRNDTDEAGGENVLLSTFSLPEAVTSSGETELPSELDGSKVEAIDVEWRSTKDALLTEKWKGNSPQILSMQLTFALSGQKNYDVGEVEIKIPKVLVHDRKGNPVGENSLSVPKAPDNSGLFSYTDMGDFYLITNTKKMSAASSGVIQSSIQGLTPSEIQDMATGYKTLPYYAEIRVVTEKKNTIFKRSREIQAQFDTSASLSSATIRHNEMMYESFPKSFPEQLKPENPEDFYYAKFDAHAYSIANQYFSVTADVDARKDGWEAVSTSERSERWEASSTSEGNERWEAVFDQASEASGDNQNAILLGVSYEKNKKVYPVNAPSGTVSLEEGVYAKDGQNFYLSAYVAYPKKDFSKDRKYSLDAGVTFTMTALDDNNTTTSASSVTLPFQPLRPEVPTGSFYTDKNGYGENREYMGNGKTEGLYPTAMNDISDGRPVSVEFWSQVRAYPGNFTLRDGGNPKNIDDYNQKSVKLVSEDYEMNFHNESPMTSSDFEFSSLRFGKPSIRGFFELSDGSVTNEYTGTKFSVNSTPIFGYKALPDSEIPVIHVFGQIGENSDYVPLADISYTSGSPEMRVQNGAFQDGGRLVLPAGTVKWKTEIDTTLSYFVLNIYPTVTVKPSSANRQIVSSLFQNSTKPETYLKNKVRMNVVASNKTMFVNQDIGRDRISGFASGAKLDKDLVAFSNDVSKQLVNLKYRVSATIQTNLLSKEEIAEAVKKGLFQEEKEATFYDLLPKGVIADTKTIRLRPNDKIESVEVKENFKGSGRQMLIVKAKLSPSYYYSWSNETILQTKGYKDEPEMEFSATYSWYSLSDFGEVLNNSAAYESGNRILGSVKGLRGEPDTPYKGNNNYSKYFVETSDAAEYFRNINPKHNNPSFLYAANTRPIHVDVSGLTYLAKFVDVNGEGLECDGLDEAMPKNVYENGYYDYYIRVKSSVVSKTKDILFFDSLENYKPTEDKADWGDTQWKGTLVRVDASQLKEKGIDAKVYYSTKKGLVLDNTDNRHDNNLEDSSIWSELAPSDLSTVTAIAVDATKGTGGEDFLLDANESLVVRVTMQAPKAKEGYFDKKLSEGEKEEGLSGGAHAYNNISMISSSVSKDTGAVSADKQMIRHDYTKVGLTPYSITVKKIFDDGFNRDGIRPETVKVTLLANGKETENTAILGEAGEDGTKNFSHTFSGLSYFDENGQKIIYSVKETLENGEDVPGYQLVTEKEKEDENGLVLRLKNVHKPLTTKIEGEKKWEDGGNPIHRPKDIRISLLANGKPHRSLTVKPDANGKWSYVFDDLFVNENGKKIEYSVKEASYTKGYAASYDNFTITNTYHPYGSLTVSKNTLSETEAAKAKNPDFTFQIFLYDKDGNVTTEKIDYEKGTEKGSISSTGTFTLKSKESITFPKIPSDVKYKVEEVSLPSGYSLNVQKSDKMEGVLKAGEEKKLLVTNDYSSSGEVRLTVKKELSGRDMFPAEFLFDTYEVIGDRKIYRESSYNDKEGNVNISVFHYTNDDIAKSPVTYEITERNLKRGGVTYDTHTETVLVDLKDNGDGTITATPRYDKDGAVFHNTYKATGSVTLKAYKQIGSGFELKHREAGWAYFKDVMKEQKENGKLTAESVVLPPTYPGKGDPEKDWFIRSGMDPELVRKANEGSISGGASSLRNMVRTGTLSTENMAVPAVSTLAIPAGEPPKESTGKSYDITGHTFDFEVIDKESGKVMAKGQNNEKGEISFSPISFTEKDVGKTFVFRAREKVGEDSTIIYDPSDIDYFVTVFDNKDGTLSFDAYAVDNYTADMNNHELEPVFVNKFKDASLTISKAITKKSMDLETEYTTPFRFKLRITGDEKLVPTGDFKVQRETPSLPPVKAIFDNYYDPQNTPPISLETTPGRHSFKLPDGVWDIKVENPDSHSVTTVQLGKKDVFYTVTESGDVKFENSQFNMAMTGRTLTFYLSTFFNGTTSFDYLIERVGRDNIVFRYGENLISLRAGKWHFTNADSPLKDKILQGSVTVTLKRDGAFYFENKPVNVKLKTISKTEFPFTADISRVLVRKENGGRDIVMYPENGFMGKAKSYGDFYWEDGSKVKFREQLPEEPFENFRTEGKILLEEGAPMQLFAMPKRPFPDFLPNIAGFNARNMDISGLFTKNATFFVNMFLMSSAENLDVSGLDMTGAISVAGMFQESSAKRINLRTFTGSNLSASGAPKSTQGMFKDSKAQSIDISGFTACKFLPPDPTMFQGAAVNDIPDSVTLPTNYPGRGNVREDWFVKSGLSPKAAGYEGEILIPKLPGVSAEAVGSPKETPSSFAPLAFGSLRHECLTLTRGEKTQQPLATLDSGGRLFSTSEAQPSGGRQFRPASVASGEKTSRPGMVRTGAVEPKGDVLHFVNGEATFTLRQGESITLPKLPAGLSYEVLEETPEGWVVDSARNTSGILAPDTAIEARFVNDKTLSKKSFVISGKKLLDGKPAEGFEFELYRNGRYLAKATSLADGTFSFAPILYDGTDEKGQAISEKDYVVKEKADTEKHPGVVFDTNEWTVKVTSDEGSVSNFAVNYYPKGSQASEASGEMVFRNEMKKGTVIIHKLLVGMDDVTARYFSNQVFDVVFKHGEKEERFKLTAFETKVFKNIPYGEKYEIFEENLPDGWISKTPKITGVVNQERVGETLENTFSKKTLFSPTNVKKTLEGGELKDGEFQFAIYGEKQFLKDVVISPVLEQMISEGLPKEAEGYVLLGLGTNDANGNVHFDNFEVDHPGNFTFFVREINGGREDIIYDSSVKKVITSLDYSEGTGYLVDSVVLGGKEPVFTNRVKTPPAPSVPEVPDTSNLVIHKEVVGPHTDKAFRFTFDIGLSPAYSEEKYPSLKQYANALPALREMSYSYAIFRNGEEDPIRRGTIRPGETFLLKDGEYFITSEFPSVEDTEGPTNIQLFHPVVTEEKDGMYRTEISEITDESYFADVKNHEWNITVKNTFSANGELSFSAKKELQGADIQDYTFHFLLLKDGDVVERVENDSNGEIHFSPQYFTQDDIGKSFEYQIVEEEGTIPGMRYDRNAFVANVSISTDENGMVIANSLQGDVVFKNVMQFALPMTGSIAIYIPVTLLIAGVVVSISLRKRKKS